MVTMDGYKLIVYPQAQRLRLYHLAHDPDEIVDLADDAEYRPIIRRLFTRLLQLQSEMGDTLDLRTSFPAWL